MTRGKGKLSSNVGEAGAHVRVADGATAPDFQILMGPVYYFDNGFRTYPNPAFTLAPSFLRPRSRRAASGCARPTHTTSRRST